MSNSETTTGLKYTGCSNGAERGSKLTAPPNSKRWPRGRLSGRSSSLDLIRLHRERQLTHTVQTWNVHECGCVQGPFKELQRGNETCAHFRIWVRPLYDSLLLFSDNVTVKSCGLWAYCNNVTYHVQVNQTIYGWLINSRHFLLPFKPLEASFIIEFVSIWLGLIHQKLPGYNLPHVSGSISLCASSDTPLSNWKLTKGEPWWVPVNGWTDERTRSRLVALVSHKWISGSTNVFLKLLWGATICSLNTRISHIRWCLITQQPHDRRCAERRRRAAHEICFSLKECCEEARAPSPSDGFSRRCV